MNYYSQTISNLPQVVSSFSFKYLPGTSLNLYHNIQVKVSLSFTMKNSHFLPLFILGSLYRRNSDVSMISLLSDSSLSSHMAFFPCSSQQKPFFIHSYAIHFSSLCFSFPCKKNFIYHVYLAEAFKHIIGFSHFVTFNLLIKVCRRHSGSFSTSV